MKNRILTILLLSIAFNIKAQNSNIAFEDRIIKTKLVKTVSYDTCEKMDLNKNAVVLEFDVQLEEDKKIFGDKIYAATLCYDFPGEGSFDRKKDLDLKLYETKYYQWEISILDEKLLDKNVGKKHYWVKSCGRKITLHCSPSK